MPSRVPLSMLAMRGTDHPCPRGPQGVIDPGLEDSTGRTLLYIHPGVFEKTCTLKFSKENKGPKLSQDCGLNENHRNYQDFF